MSINLSIRSYSLKKYGHSHPFHQLVLPLQGAINIELADYSGKVTPGECVVIKAHSEHHFTAELAARFLVADIDELPDSLSGNTTMVFPISRPLFRFIHYVESQLEFQANDELEQMIFQTFFLLLSEQKLFKKRDLRIQACCEHIENQLSTKLNIAELSKIACLSATQFKKHFKQQTGLTVTQYITQLRMEKAKALILHTDYPLQIIAEKVGYTDFSAFSRRFSQQFGLAPSKIAH